MARARYLVSYDIADPKRLRRVARAIEGYGHRLQYSVFECPLDPLRLSQLQGELQDIINHHEDQILFVHLGPETEDVGLRFHTLGLPNTLRPTRVTIIG